MARRATLRRLARRRLVRRHVANAPSAAATATAAATAALYFTATIATIATIATTATTTTAAAAAAAAAWMVASFAVEHSEGAALHGGVRPAVERLTVHGAPMPGRMCMCSAVHSWQKVELRLISEPR